MTVVLHEKYRPKRFADVFGQGHFITNLAAIIKARSSHAFMFSGPAGCGKTTIARICARRLDCSPIDIREIDGATTTGIDDMRALQEGVRYKPLGSGSARAVILDEAHRVSRQAFDSLLKVLEEPPSHLFWFLCTTAPEKVPVTVRTRCTAYAVKALPGPDTLQFVKDIAGKEALSTPDDVLAVVAGEAQGSLRQALVNLTACADCKNQREAKAALAKLDEGNATIELCRLLVNGGSWIKAMSVIEKLEGENPEGVRIVVVNYVASALKKTNNDKGATRLLTILDNFAGPYNDSERLAPLLLSIGRTLYDT